LTKPPVPEFSELQHKVFALLYETSDLLLKCEDAAYAEFGLSQQQFLVLKAIESSDKPFVKIIDVARKLKRNSNSISMIIDRMERAGLVERVRDLQDRRSVHLSLTEKGTKKLYQASKVGWSLISRLMSCFSEEEMETLTSLIEKLRGKTSEELNPGKAIRATEKLNVETAKRLLHG
jgi:DNA-binding MarR family transcriptional regulator